MAWAKARVGSNPTTRTLALELAANRAYSVVTIVSGLAWRSATPKVAGRSPAAFAILTNTLTTAG